MDYLIKLDRLNRQNDRIIILVFAYQIHNRRVYHLCIDIKYNER